MKRFRTISNIFPNPSLKYLYVFLPLDQQAFFVALTRYIRRFNKGIKNFKYFSLSESHMSTRFFFTGHSIYEFAALTNITVETEGPSEFSVSGLVFVFEPNSSSSSSFHLTVFSILLLSPLIPDICHFWYATTFDLGRGVRSDVKLSHTETRFKVLSQWQKWFQTLNVINIYC